MKILKKSKGKWLAVSLVTATALMVSGGFVNEVAAQDNEISQSAESDVVSEIIDASGEHQVDAGSVAVTVLEAEQAKALEQMDTEWEMNTLSEVTAEIERQKQLALPRYVIQWGDTLSQLAVASQTTVADLATLNRIANPDLIYAGNTLEGVLYPSRTVASTNSVWTAKNVTEIREEMQRQAMFDTQDYQIQWGDTLNGIAQVTGVTVADLTAHNQIANPNLIYAGDFLKGLLKPFKRPVTEVAPAIPQVNAKITPTPLPVPAPPVQENEPFVPKEEVMQQPTPPVVVPPVLPKVTELEMKPQEQPELPQEPTAEVVPPTPAVPETPKETPETEEKPQEQGEQLQDTEIVEEKPQEQGEQPQDTEIVEEKPQEQPEQPQEPTAEVVPPTPAVPETPKETPETEEKPQEQPELPQEPTAEVVPPTPAVPETPKETPETEEKPQEPPLLTRPQLTLQHQVLNPMQKNAIMQYTLNDPDQVFVRGIARLLSGQQVIQEVTLSPERQVIFTGLAYGVPYQVATTFVYRMNGEEVSEQVDTTPHDYFELTFKKIELKNVESITIQPIDNSLMPSLTDSIFNGDTHIARIKLAGLNDIYAPITSVEPVTVEQQSAYRVTMSLPELVQYDANGHHYNEHYVALFDTSGNLLTAPNAPLDYSRVNGYDAARQNAYHNVEKLLPYYNRELIVQYGNLIDIHHDFATKAVKSILPMHGETLSVALRSDKLMIHQLLVQYEDGTLATLPVTFSQDFANRLIAEYQITGTDLIYTPTQWQTDYSPVINSVVETLRNISYYSANIWRALGEKGRPSSVNMDQLYLKESFQYVQTQLPTILEKVLHNSGLRLSDEGLATYILQNKEKLLIGLAYVNKWYDVNFGALNLKDTLLYRQEFFGKPVNQLEWLIGIGSRTYEGLRPNETPQTYAQILAPQTGYATIPAFLSGLRAQFLPHMSDNEWFKQATKAFIAEIPSQTPNVQVNVYDKLSREHLANTLLPLLSLSEETLYIIPTMATVSFGDFATYVDVRLKDSDPVAYQKAVEQFKQTVINEAINHTAHFDMWHRIALPHVKNKLQTYAIPVWDTFIQQATHHWSERQGDTTTKAIREFFGPTGHWHNKATIGAFSDGVTIWFYTDRLLRQGGAAGGSVFTHEVVHVLEDDIYLGGHARRQGFGQESYAEGLLQSIRDRTRASISMNLYTVANDRKQIHLHNANLSPERFQSADDLKQYMHGLLDVLYVLDYAEAMSIAKLPAYMKQLVLKKMTPLKDSDSNHTSDFIEDFSGQEWNTIQFDKIEDFIENHAVVTRHHYKGARITGGELADRNTYSSVPLFSPMYGLLENAKGGSGGYTFRRTAFELLAHKGYEAGMIPYISNQLSAKAASEGEVLSDTYIAREVLGEAFSNLTEFKKAMFQERIAKLDRLQTVNVNTRVKNNAHIDSFATLQALMDQAVRNDADEMYRTGKEPSGWVHNLKEKLFSAYLQASNEFRTSIFWESGE